MKLRPMGWIYILTFLVLGYMGERLIPRPESLRFLTSVGIWGNLLGGLCIREVGLIGRNSSALVNIICVLIVLLLAAGQRAAEAAGSHLPLMPALTEGAVEILLGAVLGHFLFPRVLANYVRKAQ